MYLLQLEFCFTSSFSYTRTRTNTCCPLWFRTPLSSDPKIARLRFLFILRLRTGIDLRDEADLAPARSVTIRSWFSDCISASSLARRSWIVRVASHQIEVISTHRKIGHFTSIKWYQLSRLIGQFYLVFSPSYSPQKPTKNYFQVRSFPSSRLALHILSISVFVEFVCLRIQLLLVTCVFCLLLHMFL
jgi:hypothetical protein